MHLKNQLRVLFTGYARVGERERLHVTCQPNRICLLNVADFPRYPGIQVDAYVCKVGVGQYC